MKKEVKVTKAEALERVEDNFETLNSIYGTIRANTGFFVVCAGVSLVSGVIGTGLLIAGGLAVAPVIATGFGIVGTTYSAIQIKKQADYEAEVNEVWNQNVDTKDKIIAKSKKIR